MKGDRWVRNEDGQDIWWIATRNGGAPAEESDITCVLSDWTVVTRDNGKVTCSMPDADKRKRRLISAQCHGVHWIKARGEDPADWTQVYWARDCLAEEPPKSKRDQSSIETEDTSQGETPVSYSQIDNTYKSKLRNWTGKIMNSVIGKKTDPVIEC